MTAMEKNAIYDRLCMALTNYEQRDNGLTEEEIAEDLYAAAFDVVTNWEELTSEQEG